MKLFRVLKAAWAAKKARKHMFGFLKSKTTGNVAKAGGVSAAVIAFARTLYPDLIPWPTEYDAAAAVLATTILGRVWAWKNGHLAKTIEPMTPAE